MIGPETALMRGVEAQREVFLRKKTLKNSFMIVKLPEVVGNQLHSPIAEIGD